MRQERGTARKRSHALRWWIGGIAVVGGVVGGLLAYVASTRPTVAEEYAAYVVGAEARADAEFAETLRTACQMVSQATAPAEDVGRPWEGVALLRVRFAVMATALGSYEPMDVDYLPGDENRARIDATRGPLLGAESGASNLVFSLSSPVPPGAESLQHRALQDATNYLYAVWRDAYFALELEPGGATAALIADREDCGVLRAMVAAGESSSGLDTIGPAAPG